MLPSPRLGEISFDLLVNGAKFALIMNKIRPYGLYFVLERGYHVDRCVTNRVCHPAPLVNAFTFTLAVVPRCPICQRNDSVFAS